MCVIANLAQLPFAQKCLGIVGIYDKININQVSQPTFGEYDIAVYDAGVPQKSAMASVVVNVQNLNDESPVFEQPEGYSASGKQSILKIKQSMLEIKQSMP